MKRIALFSISLFLIAGCGGGGSGAPAAGRKVNVTIHWPAQTRGLTLADSVRLSLERSDGTAIDSETVDRFGISAYDKEIVFDDPSGVATSTYQLDVTQFLGAAGSGTLLGGQTLYGSNFDVDDVPINFHMSLTGPSSIQRGQNEQMVIKGVTDSGAQFSFPSDLINWEVTPTTGDPLVTVTAAGQLYAYNNHSSGVVTVRATIKNDGGSPVSQSVSIRVL